MSNLKRAIEESRIRKAEICKQAEISRTHLFYLENNLRKPSFEVISKLSRILNKTCEELFFEEVI